MSPFVPLRYELKQCSSYLLSLHTRVSLMDVFVCVCACTLSLCVPLPPNIAHFSCCLLYQSEQTSAQMGGGVAADRVVSCHLLEHRPLTASSPRSHTLENIHRDQGQHQLSSHRPCGFEKLLKFIIIYKVNTYNEKVCL